MKKLMVCVLIGVMAILLGFSQGCRTKSRVIINYAENGRVAQQIYEQESGFHFFSDGAGKVISPELSINGLNF